MKIFQEEPIFKAGFTYKEVVGLIVTVFFSVPLLVFISTVIINNFIETIELLNLIEKRKVLFFYESGYHIGLTLLLITIFAYLFLALPVLINRRFSKKIIGWSSIIGGLALLASIITAPISSFLVESYIEEKGYSRCSYYSGSGYNPVDYYVFDSKYCVSAVSILTNKALPWFEEANKKGEVDYDEFLLKVEQWKAESPRYKK